MDKKDLLVLVGTVIIGVVFTKANDKAVEILKKAIGKD